jgi:pyridoxamine 5'-phosphate oxidase
MGTGINITDAPLHKRDLDPDPVRQFETWLNEAKIRPEEIEPTAMVLATVSLDSKPSTRVVLLKEIEDGTFIFFTNYRSRKSEEIINNPHVSAVFWWRTLARQVRIEGLASKISEEKSKAYFDTRPLGSRLSAIVSPQSKPVENRAVLEEKLKIEEAKLEKEEKPICPPYWGGFRIKPDRFEFWQGRPNRLHDSFRYQKEQDHWSIERLGP